MAGFLLRLFWTRFLGKESWRRSRIVAASTSLLGYLIFGERAGTDPRMSTGGPS